MRKLLQDRMVRLLFVGGFIYAFVFSQGIPLWDDDFTSWFWKIKDKSVFHYLWEWLWPISTQPEYWGFNERPLQSLIFKFLHSIAGYNSWIYFLYRDVIYAAMGVMVYLWGLRLTKANDGGRIAAFAGALFLLLAPCTMAAHVLNCDFASTAEFLFLVITYVMWDQIEKTPEEWSGRPSLKDPEHKKWLLRWAGLSFVTYLGYKSKADLKLIPLILVAYVFLVRRRQWKFFAVPAALMFLLAIPWGPGIFSKLPPFLPGSGGSQIGWMWQPASFSRLTEFLWSSVPYHFFDHLRSPTFSLLGLMGPFLLIGVVAFLVWRVEALDKVPWTRLSQSSDRARLFMLIWLAGMIVAVSSLAPINHTFRIRYGILTVVPAAILLAWLFGVFAESVDRLPKWIFRAAIVIFAIQCAANLYRSVNYRRDLGQVIIATDQVYDYVRTKLPGTIQLTLLPDFRPYDYRPDAGEVFAKKEWLSSTNDLVTKHKPFNTYVISWNPSLWDSLELVEKFPGCGSSLFDLVIPCKKGGSYLMRYIGRDPLYQKGEELRAKGDIAGAMQVHEEFLTKYPGNLAGHFVVGLEAYQLKNWARAETAYGKLEKYFPDHLSILYNRALALGELKRYKEAADRLKTVIAQEPANYAALINLYYIHRKAGEKGRAKDLAVKMKKLFPNNGEIDGLLRDI